MNERVVLCAVHEGDWGTRQLNLAIERALVARQLIKRNSEWYEGRPIMVTRNDVGAVTSASTVGAAGTETQCYQYDSLLELTSAWTVGGSDCATTPTVQSLGGPSPYWVDYTYDKATGNRL